MRNVLKVCFVIIGTIIGAGFASGKEIYSFFNVYGFYGFLGLIIANRNNRNGYIYNIKDK